MSPPGARLGCLVELWGKQERGAPEGRPFRIPGLSGGRLWQSERASRDTRLTQPIGQRGDAVR